MRPQSEFFEIMMDPTPYSRSYVNAFSVHTEGYRRYTQDEGPKKQDAEVEASRLQPEVENDGGKCM
jgi:hypothetical protein